MTKGGEAPNLMELRPRHLAEWEEGTGGVIVHAPRGRFLTFMARWFGRSELVRLHLDELGSFVWRRCDGSHIVIEIVEELEGSSEEEPESILPRVATFLKRLSREKLITYEEYR